MKIVTGAEAAVVLFALGACLGTAVPAFAQSEPQGVKHDQKQARPEKPQGQQAKGGPTAQQQGKSAPQVQPSGQQKAQQQIPEHSQRPARQEQVQRTQQPPPPQHVEPARTPQRPQLAQQQPQRIPPSPPQRSQQQAQAWQQKRGWQQPGAWQGHDTWQAGRAGRWTTEHRTWAQRGGYGGFYVPQDRFSLSFGNDHFFRLQARPVIYQGYPRFDYGGYSFLLVDPWPEYWSDNWYAVDDLYIDYDEGYYLHNRNYSQVRLAITVAL